MTDGNAHIVYSFADIERYLSGSMTAKEMHELERAALQDPFLTDAIEGYQNADKKLADKHLNEIAASLQKEEPAKVILMPEKKRYGWLVAASLLAITGTGIFFLTKQNQSSKSLAANNIKKEKSADLLAEDSKMLAPQTDSQPSDLSGNLEMAEPEKTEADKRILMPRKKMLSDNKDMTSKPQRESAEASTMTMASPAPSVGYFKDTNTAKKPVLQPSEDSLSMKMSLSEVIVTRALKQQNKPVNTWTTDKGKPFLLSDVEVINLGNKKREHADTSAIQPEGGWQSFHNYLFSRLNRRDSLLLANNNFISTNLELEFSVDKSGLPYDIKVFNTLDSTVTNKIVDAIQSGPKWKSGDSQEKRLRIRY